MSGKFCGLMLALALLCGGATSWAQETVDSASVGGRVTDPQGATVPGATVTIRQLATNVTREETTDNEGRFRFTYVKVGQYELMVALTGFTTVKRPLTLNAGAAFEIPIQLVVGGLDTTVTVTGGSEVLESARSQIATTISQAEVAAMPSNGRSSLDLSLYAPGVSPTNVGSSQLFAETSAVPGGGLSVSSQRNFSNNFIVDGLSGNDDAAGLSGTAYSMDAVEQVQVVTSGGQAELGRALGGYFNVVTRSGTNQHRFDGYSYFRDQALNAANAISHTTLPMDEQQGGGSAGGPVAKDRTFYFANVEHRNLDQSGLVTITPANADAINARLSQLGYRGPGVATGVYANPVDSTNLLAKVDQSLGRRDQLSVRFVSYDVSSSNSRGAGGLSAPSASAALDNQDRTASFGNVVVLSDRTVNETRGQIVHSSLDAPASDPFGPSVAIAGVATFGTLSTSPTARDNTMFQIVDNLSHQAGTHALRAGVDFIYNDDTIGFPRSIKGAYTFSSLANFLSGTYNNAGFAQTFGVTQVSQTNPNAGLYLQDEWKATPDLTINAGLRYDLQFLQTIATDRNNLSPRIGAAWTPFESRRTVVRGGAGRYYDRVPLRALANALLSAGNSTDISQLQQVLVTLSPTQAGAPVFPAALASPTTSVTLPNLTTMQPDIKNAYSDQASAEIEQQIGTRTTVTAGYQYMRGRNLIISVNQNVPSCVASGTNNGCRPNPAFGNNSQYTSAASSSYHGLHLSFVQRPTAWGHYRVSYTLSKAMSNVGEFFFSSPIDPFDLDKDWGRSDDDQRHRLSVSGGVTLPGRLQVSGALRAYSALPLNITSGLTTVQGTTARPLVNGAFIDRNAGVGPDFFTLDLRVSRRFYVGSHASVEGLIEGFNLTNRTNILALNGNFGAGAFPSAPSASFRQITAVADPRAFQIGFRVSFGQDR